MCEQDNDNHFKLRCRDQYRTYDRPFAPARLTSIAAGALSCSANHTFSPFSAFPGQSSGGLGVMGQFLAILGKEDSYAPRSFCVAFESRWLTVGCRNAPAHNKQIRQGRQRKGEHRRLDLNLNP
ncbi:hypothetical protein MCOR19_007466 [Pyricularia oryzae]|nr:hypothetical protein MCOR19_007466 [Pyricularia oryzae]